MVKEKQMIRDLTFSGPVTEGFMDDDGWSIGGQDTREPLQDAIRDLCEVALNEAAEYVLRVDIDVDPEDGGYHATMVNAVGGYVEGLVDDETPTADPNFHQEVHMRGEVNFDPHREEYLLGHSSIYQSVHNAISAIIGPHVSRDASAVNLAIVLQMEESNGFDDLARLDKVVHMADSGGAADGQAPVEEPASAAEVG
jgi:hypothetical protein